MYRIERVAWTRFTVSGLHIPLTAWLVRSTVWAVFVTGPIESIQVELVIAMCRAEMIPPDRDVEREPTEDEAAIEFGRLVMLN